MHIHIHTLKHTYAGCAKRNPSVRKKKQKHPCHRSEPRPIRQHNTPSSAPGSRESAPGPTSATTAHTPTRSIPEISVLSTLHIERYDSNSAASAAPGARRGPPPTDTKPGSQTSPQKLNGVKSGEQAGPRRPPPREMGRHFPDRPIYIRGDNPTARSPPDCTPCDLLPWGDPEPPADARAPRTAARPRNNTPSPQPTHHPIRRRDGHQP